MSYSVDTNILTALSQNQSWQNSTVRQAIRKLHALKEKVYILPQNLIEYTSVATRPMNVNGLNLTTQKTLAEINIFLGLFSFIDDQPNLFSVWKGLVQKHGVKGKNVHDTRIVAAMVQHRITHLLTFNGKHFRKYSEITVIDPTSF